MNGTNIVALIVDWTRTPVAQALWETAKYGAPKIVEAVKQQTAVTAADVAQSTEGFASAADVPLDAPAESVATEPLPLPEEQSHAEPAP
jgi:hypothetical protein